MKFVDPEYEEVYKTLTDNNKLRKFLTDNYALTTVDDFYDNYGMSSKIDKKRYVEKANEQVYKNLSQVLLAKKDTIKNTSVSLLVKSEFLFDDIREALGFREDVKLNNEIYWEIFYCYKYCFVSSFFQNNWERFLPEEDFSQIKNNDAADAFLDAVMKEFDKLDVIINNSTEFHDYKDIPFEYINYLSQLLGCEQKTFMMDKDMAAQYRELAENILDVYSKKGTPATFELLFNFLGITVKSEEYYFDRRRYYSKSGMNLQMGTSDASSYKFYLTTDNPAYNYKGDIATNETVSPADFSKMQNIRNFDKLVEQYGLMCVLGYDDEYEVLEEVDDGAGEITHFLHSKPYTGEVFKYFKTNYLRLKPALKFVSGNFTLDQLYQISAVLNLLTPEFCARELYVEVDIGSREEQMVLNWTRNDKEDDFYMLDSEDWNQFQVEKYVFNAKEVKESEYRVMPMVYDDLGREKRYYNSLGVSQHEVGEKKYNAFFNPISNERIKLINTTRYWGDKVKIEGQKGAIYPVWRQFMNVKEGNKVHYEEPISAQSIAAADGSKRGTEVFYLPKHYKYLDENTKREWDKTTVVSLNGYEGNSIRRYIKEMKNYAEVQWTTTLPINIFLKEKLTDAEQAKYKLSTTELETRKKFFAKEWRKVPNYTWSRVGTLLSTAELVSFISKNKNIINYDYVKGQLFSNNDFFNLGFNKKYNGYILADGPSRNERRSLNNRIAENLLASMDNDGCYFVCADEQQSRFYVYQKRFVKKIGNVWLNKFRPTPDRKNKSSDYMVTNFKSLLDSINDQGVFYYDKTGDTVNLLENTTAVFYVDGDKAFYKPLIQTTNFKGIIHQENKEVRVQVLIEMNSDKVDAEATKEGNVLGSFYLKNSYIDDNLSFSVNENKEEKGNYSEPAAYAELRKTRDPAIYQYKYRNIHKNDLIYCAYDGKVYSILTNGVYSSTDEFEAAEITLTPTEQEGLTYMTRQVNNTSSREHVYGVEEVNFKGRLQKDKDGKYRIYEYDKDYKGFSEQDDEDNYILSNYEREVSWSGLDLNLGAIQRPTREGTDLLYEENNKDDFITKLILKEICSSINDLSDKDLVTWKV